MVTSVTKMVTTAEPGTTNLSADKNFTCCHDTRTSVSFLRYQRESHVLIGNVSMLEGGKCWAHGRQAYKIFKPGWEKLKGSTEDIVLAM